MKHIVLMLCLLTIVFPAAAADSVNDTGTGIAEIKEMGLLNGQALACSRTEAVTRIKSTIIKLAPKSRNYGEAFETATNDGYLAQARSGKATCLDAAVFTVQIEEIARRLQAALTVNSIEPGKP